MRFLACKMKIKLAFAAPLWYNFTVGNMMK